MTAGEALSIRPGSSAAWRVAIRPRTLWIATVPVFVGTSVAWAQTGAFDALAAMLALAASVLMQVITNLQNDVGYTRRGLETGTRVGMPRATANGWLQPGQVRGAIAGCIVVAVAVGLPLAAERGWPVIAMGVGSILAAIAYMGGPRPISYTPFGELTVFVFFGLVAVCGSAYVQGAGGSTVWLAATATGMLAAAVLAVNNHRDVGHDRATGRQTLPVVLGTALSARLYALLVLAPFALAIAMVPAAGSAWFALPLMALPWAVRLATTLAGTPAGPALTGVLLRTVMLEVAFGALLTLGAILSRGLPVPIGS